MWCADDLQQGETVIIGTYTVAPAITFNEVVSQLQFNSIK